MTYVDGFVVAVPADRKADYLRMAEVAAPIFMEHGALRVVECWGADVPEGKTTDFRRAVKAEEGEEIVFAWIAWPSKAARDEAHPKCMNDPRMDAFKEMPFDGKRMIFGGFDVVLDTGRD